MKRKCKIPVRLSLRVPACHAACKPGPRYLECNSRQPARQACAQQSRKEVSSAGAVVPGSSDLHPTGSFPGRRASPSLGHRGTFDRLSLFLLSESAPDLRASLNCVSSRSESASGKNSASLHPGRPGGSRFFGRSQLGDRGGNDAPG